MSGDIHLVLPSLCQHTANKNPPEKYECEDFDLFPACSTKKSYNI